MQKIFIRFFAVITCVTVSLTLAVNFLLQTEFAQRRAERAAAQMMGEISDRIETNERVLQDLKASLSENYIVRARALGEVIAQNPDILNRPDELARIATLIKVDEIHIIDRQGILRWGTVPAYYGMDFASTDQTRPFLSGLTDQSFELAQEPQPNGNEGKLFQYIGVARQDEPGVVQVGVSPDVLEHALANNQMDVVIDHYNVEAGVHVTAFQRDSGVVVGDSGNVQIGLDYSGLEIPQEYFQMDRTSGWVGADRDRFAVMGAVGDYIIAVTFTKDYLYAGRTAQNITTTVSCVLLGATIIVSVFLLLKRCIIEDVELVNRDLKRITQGDLTVTVSACATPEFVSLSQGINSMVGSIRGHLGQILQQSAQLQQQAAALEEHNQSILASLSYARRIQNNLLPSRTVFDETFSDYCILWEPRDLVGGDIYWIKAFETGTVLCVCDCTGHGTPGALLAMLIVSVLNGIVRQEICARPAAILWELEQRLLSILHVGQEERRTDQDILNGADLAIVYLDKSGDVALSSAKLHVFLCDGHTVQTIRGQRLSIGEGSLKSEDQIKTVTVSACQGVSFYIATDGLFDQVGEKSGVPFGYRAFKQIILENHSRRENEIADQVWRAFEAHRGAENRRDDVTLLGFRC